MSYTLRLPKNGVGARLRHFGRNEKTELRSDIQCLQFSRGPFLLAVLSLRLGALFLDLFELCEILWCEVLPEGGRRGEGGGESSRSSFSHDELDTRWSKKREIVRGAGSSLSLLLYALGSAHGK
jgi:hypothetical protein